MIIGHRLFKVGHRPHQPCGMKHPSYIERRISKGLSYSAPHLARKEAREAGREIQWWGSPARAELGHKQQSTHMAPCKP